MSKLKLPEYLREFAAKTRIKVAAWSVTVNPKNVIISGIPSREHAERLHSFLADRHMPATLLMGDRYGETWTVVTRDRVLGLYEDE